MRVASRGPNGGPADLIGRRLRPELAAALTQQGLSATARAGGEQLFIDYEAFNEGTGYVRPSVLLEFGVRSTGQPTGRDRLRVTPGCTCRR